MRIDFQCSGGFANIKLNYLAETDDLPSELAQELLNLVTETDFFEAELKQPKGGFSPPDVFSYQIYVSKDGNQRKLSCTDVTAPKSIVPLLRKLRKLAMEELKKGK